MPLQPCIVHDFSDIHAHTEHAGINHRLGFSLISQCHIPGIIPLLNLGLFLLRRMQIPVWAERGYILAAELLVVLAEAALCRLLDGRQLPQKQYLRFSLVTNAVSFFIGLFVSALLTG